MTNTYTHTHFIIEIFHFIELPDKRTSRIKRKKERVFYVVSSKTDAQIKQTGSDVYGRWGRVTENLIVKRKQLTTDECAPNWNHGATNQWLWSEQAADYTATDIPLSTPLTLNEPRRPWSLHFISTGTQGKTFYFFDPTFRHSLHVLWRLMKP